MKIYNIELPIKKVNESDKEYENRVKANENYLNQMLKDILAELERLGGS